MSSSAITPLKSLSEIDNDSPIFLAPAGNASEKVMERIRQLRPDINILGYVDSYKSGERAGVAITRLNQLTHEQLDTPVIVTIERQDLQNRIASSLAEHGMSDVKVLSDEKALHCHLPEQEKKTLYFYYDLSLNALNFEFLNSLCHIEVERIRRGYDYVHVVIVPNVEDPIFDLSRTAVNGELESDNNWFMDNVIVPACSLIPAIKGVTVIRSRNEAVAMLTMSGEDSIPDGYSLETPVELKSSAYLYDASQGKHGHTLPFRASSSGLAFVRQWLRREGITEQDKPVVITLREVAYQTERNSNLSVWKAFADKISTQGYTPIFVRDTYAAFSDNSFADYIEFSEAAWNLYLRISLYEVAYLNMMGCTGPHTLCTYNKRTRYIIFNTLLEGGYVGSKEFLEDGGIPAERQYFARQPYQHAVWGKDQTVADVLQAFYAMVEVIESPSSEE